MNDHEEIVDLIGAYALDAVDPDEAEIVERHLETCPKCRAELADLREVAGMLGYAGGPAPEGLWDRIAASLEEPPPALRLGRITKPLLPAVAVEAASNSQARADAATTEETGPPLGQILPLVRRGRVGSKVAGLIAVAALALVAVLGVQVSNLNERTNHLRALLNHSSPTLTTIITALSTPGAREVSMVTPEHQKLLKAVILPDGQGWLFDAQLHPLPSSETYQLWGMQGAELVSYGLLGRAPGISTFRAGKGVLALAVTEEQAGGVVKTDHSPVVTGSIRTLA